MKCPAAPAPHEYPGVKPRRVVLPKDTVLHRIHPAAFPADNWYHSALKPGVLGNRFDWPAPPFENWDVLYAGDTEECAIAERLLRWHLQMGRPRFFSASILKDLVMSQITTADRDHSLVELSGLGLARFTPPFQDFDGVLLSDADDYPLTQQWGTWLISAAQRHEEGTGRQADGSTWRTRHNNDLRAYVLFEPACGKTVRHLASTTAVPLAPRKTRLHDLVVSQLQQIDVTSDYHAVGTRLR